MTYLYGDSTDSGLELNYIELLREFLDFAVQLMLSEYRIENARIAADDSKRMAGAELERLRGLGLSVTTTLDKAKSANAGSSTDQSIAALRSSTEHTLRRAAEALKAKVTQNEQQLLVSRQRERAGNAKLIERLLLQHDLPDSQNTVDFELNGDGSGYQAEVKGLCKQGLSWRFVADIPDTHVLSAICKVSSLQPQLTIQLPEMSGLLRKSVKLKPYRVFPLFVTSVQHKDAEIIIKLRSAAQYDDDTGLDLRVQTHLKRVSITRCQKGETSPPFDAEEADAGALLELSEQVSGQTAAIVDNRTKMLEVRFDKLPLSACEDPTVLVSRLMHRIGPVVQKISAHSLGTTELVLKRVLANDRREEIFASKADLLGKVAAVPPQLRKIFAPLGLGDLGAQLGDHDPTNRVNSLPQALVAKDRSAPEALAPRPLIPAPPRVPTVEASDPDEEPTKVVGENDIVDDEAHEITAMAADEEDQITTSARPPGTLIPRTMDRTIKTPAAPPRMASVDKTTTTAPAQDSIDVALAELEADS